MYEEMMEHAKIEAETYYATILDTMNDKIEQLASTNAQLASQIDHLENLLKQNNIQFD